ncbi:MAG: DNA-binding response regulator [Bacteroidetes bacterium]|nr:MAG: DNA-binding response regulator [Bacteroidota bacterium]
MKLRCLIVDDESMARKLIEEYVQQIPFLELAGTCRNPFEAMEAMQKGPVDLLFLDIQMPGMLGTKFLESMREKPMVIFITAYSNYAVESYDLEVVDYLMKPVTIERFTRAVNKAMEEKQKREALMVPQVQAGPEEPDYFFVNVEYSLVKVPVKEITHIEGMKDYIKIYLSTSKKPIITKSTLKGIEEKLPPGAFMRVHKSFIVRLDKIESIRSQYISIGTYEVPVSESNTEELLRLLKYTR